MEEIVFVTHNKGKIASAQKQLAGVNVKIFEYELDEPRSDDIKFISKAKVEEAYKLVKKPCISLDCGFWIETLGLEGILKLMEGKENRNCKFTECLSYYDGKEVHQFMGEHKGRLAKEILGNDTNEKWSDLWYIYIPSGYEKTLAQMTKEERATRKKYESKDAMKIFANWYLENNANLL